MKKIQLYSNPRINERIQSHWAYEEFKSRNMVKLGNTLGEGVKLEWYERLWAYFFRPRKSGVSFSAIVFDQMVIVGDLFYYPPFSKYIKLISRVDDVRDNIYNCEEWRMLPSRWDSLKRWCIDHWIMLLHGEEGLYMHYKGKEYDGRFED